MRPTTLIACAALTLAAATLNADYLHSNKPIPNRYIVTFNDSVANADVSGIANALAHEFQGRTIGTMSHAMKGFGAVMTEERARALSHHPLVKLVEEDGAIELADSQQGFDFATAGAVKSSTLPGRWTPQPRLVPSDCPWNGSYFLCGYSDDTFWNLDLLDNQAPSTRSTNTHSDRPAPASGRTSLTPVSTAPTQSS